MTQKKPLKIDPDRVQKILLIRLRRIGDVVMTMPAVRHIRRNFPGAELTYAVEAPYEDLVSGHPDLDHSFVLSAHAGFWEFIAWIRKIRKQKFDAVVDFHGGPRAAMIALLSGAPWKIGYKVKYKHLIYRVSLSRNPENGPVHSVENHVNLAALLGGKEENIGRLRISPPKNQEKQKIESFIQGSGLSSRKLIILHIGAGNRFRDWGEKNIIQLCNKFTALPETSLIVVGEKNDIAAAEHIAEKSIKKVNSLAGRLNLRELAALIARSQLFVGPDSGPMHIAAAVDTPIVAYFGPTLPVHFAPWRARCTILESQLNCRPCPQRNCVHGDYRCIRIISPEKVYQACLKYL